MSEATRLEIEVIKAVAVPVPPAFVRRVLRRAALQPEVAARLPSGQVAMAIRLTGDAELRRLNRTYAGKDSITDVLSFAGEKGHLGDVAVSWPAVLRQGERYGHSPETELALLCVHGLLHVLGWDHHTARETAEMTRLTRDALGRSGITPASRRL
jgi:probable rRNA maturation factor